MTTPESEAPVVESVGWSFVKVERRYHDTHEGKMVTVATVYKGNEAIARCHKVENAALIIKAVNRDHLLDEMRSAMVETREALNSCYQVADYPANGRSTQDDAIGSLDYVLDKLRALDVETKGE